MSEKKLNITIVISWSIFGKKGGAERVLCNLSNELIKRGHNITILCADKIVGTLSYPLDERVNVISYGSFACPIFLSEKFRKLRTFFYPRPLRRAYRRRLELEAKTVLLRKCLPSDSIDVFLTFSPFATYILKKAIGLHSTIPVITMIHTIVESAIEEMFPTSPGKLTPDISKIRQKEETKKLFEEFIAVVTSSDAIQVLRPEFVDVAKGIFPTRSIICIPNSVLQCESSSNLLHKTVINVGRICKVKRQHLLIEAFKFLHIKYPEWNLELWGDYSDKSYADYLRRLIESLNLSSCVKLCGSTNNIQKELERASIFAFPSEFEGFGLALTEAMALGLPVIGCKKCLAVNTIIRDGKNGFLCDDTPEGLAEALSRLMSDESLRARLGRVAKDVDSKTKCNRVAVA